MAAEKAWLKAFNTGSKSLQDRLRKVHAKNPEFQSFLGKHGFEGGSSVKQASKAQTVSKEVAAKRAALSDKAYGATTGAKMGGEHGSSDEYKDTTVPLTKDQHSKVQVAKKAAMSKDERMAAIARAVKKNKSGERFEIPTEDPDDAGYDDLRDTHLAIHHRHSVDEARDLSKDLAKGVEAATGKKKTLVRNKQGVLVAVTIPSHKAPKSGLNKFGNFASYDKLKEGFDDPKQIAKYLADKHGAENVKPEHIKNLERDSNSSLDVDDIMQHVKNLQEASLARDIQKDVDRRNARLAMAQKVKKKALATKKQKEPYFADTGEEGQAKRDLKQMKKELGEEIKGGIGDVDSTRSWVKDTLPTSCTTCHGRKAMYQTPKGDLYADKKTENSKKVACPDCDGKGYMKESAQIDEVHIDPSFVATFGVAAGAYDHILNPLIKKLKQKIADKMAAKLAKKNAPAEQQVAEGVKTLDQDSRKHSKWWVRPNPKDRKAFGKEFPLSKEKEAHEHAMAIGGSVHKMDQYGSVIKEGAEPKKATDRITTGKHGGDDASSHAVFIDGKPVFKGLTKSELPYYKKLAAEKLKEEAEQVDEGSWSDFADKEEGKKPSWSNFADKTEKQTHATNSKPKTDDKFRAYLARRKAEKLKEEAERSEYLNSKITEARQHILNKLADKMGKK